MKLLLDEHVPHALRRDIVGHDVVTVRYAGLSGLRNGVLLAAAATLGFDAVITTDTTMRYEQNLSTLPVAVVVMRGKSTTVASLRLLLPTLRTTLAVLQPRTFVEVGPL